MTTPTPEIRNPIKEQPPLLSPDDVDGKLHGLMLWENQPREGQVLSPKAPQMIGDLHLPNGEVHGVVVWVTPPTIIPGKKGQPNQQKSAYCSVARSGKDPKTNDYYRGYAGFLRPVNLINGAPVGADQVPYVQGKLTIDGQEHEVRGYVTDNGIEVMEHLGFTLEIIENTEVLLRAGAED